MLLALKLALVPGFLAALTMAGRVWGPAVAGWLAGLPVVAGPIVLLLALDRGPMFAAQASLASIAAIAASEAFNFAYAWSCRRVAWPVAALAGLLAWGAAVLLLVHLPVGLPAGLPWALAIAGVAVAISQTWLPRAIDVVPAARTGAADLGMRMLAGALLTLAVTALSTSLGAAWSGMLSVFPLLSSVLAVSVQRAQGADVVARLMRGMVIGRGSFAAFFAVTATLLPRTGIVAAFACAALASTIVQGATKRFLNRRPRRRAPA